MTTDPLEKILDIPTATPEPAPTAKVVTETPPDAFSLRAWASAKGIDASQFSSEEDLAGALLDEALLYEKAIPKLQLAERYSPHVGAIEKMLAAQGQTPAKDAVAKPAKSPKAADSAPDAASRFEMPAFDPRMLDNLVKGPDGRYQAPEGQAWLGPQADEVNRLIASRQSHRDQILDTLPEFLRKTLADDRAALKAELLKEMGETRAQEKSQDKAETAMDAFLKKHDADLYQTDDKGKRSLTTFGQSMDGHIKDLEGLGVKDTGALLKAAEAMVSSRQSAKPAEPDAKPDAKPSTDPLQRGGILETSTPEPTGPEKRQSFIDKAIDSQRETHQRETNRNGTEHDHPGRPERPIQNAEADLGEMLDDEMRKQGILPATTPEE